MITDPHPECDRRCPGRISYATGEVCTCGGRAALYRAEVMRRRREFEERVWRRPVVGPLFVGPPVRP